MSHLKAAMLFIVLLCAVACGRQVVEFGDDAGAGTPPTVTATTPANGATGVAIGTPVAATFSKAMAPATLGATTFTVQQGTSNVAGAVTLNAATNTATFTPAVSLTNGLVYSATITTGAKDLGGIALAANYTWRFTTSNGAANEPPTVIATTPPAAAGEVSLDVQLTATFSKAMDTTTITLVTFTLKQGATPVAGTVTFDGASNTATFSPTSALDFDLVYTATISTGAQDSGGVALAANYTWTFTTIASAAPPTVTSTLPATGSTGVSLGTAVSATFSQAMDPATLSAATFTVKQGTTNVAGAVTLDAVTNTAAFTPAAPLTKNLVYTATISTGAQDLAGSPLATNYTWSFTTAPNAAAPTVIATSPVDLATNVPTNAEITATFSKAMDPATLSAATFTVKQGTTSILGAVTLDGASNTATFSPAAVLTQSLVYTVTISTGAKDLGGSPLAANHTWSFTTAATTPPTVLSTTPLDLATNVTVNVQPTATFSTAMNPATITGLTFTLNQGLLAVLGVVTFNGASNTATFTPDNPLGLDLVYTATITTGAQDSNGGSLATNHTWTFTTAACSQAPVILGSASNFAVLSGSTVTSTGPSTITGDLGVSPGTAVTGFPPGIVSGTQHAGDPTAATGIADLTIAYNQVAGRTLCPVTVAGNLGGQTLPPGLYKSTSSLAVSSGDLTLDAQGDGNAVFIFQMASTLTTTAGRQVILTNGANAANVFWQVGTSASLGTTSVFQGTIMADQAITLATGATINGRLLARIAAINLDSNVIVKPAP